MKTALKAVAAGLAIVGFGGLGGMLGGPVGFVLACALVSVPAVRVIMLGGEDY